MAKLKVAKLKIVKREDGYWITGFPEGFLDTGPYTAKWEAIEDRTSITRTLENLDNRAFFTSDRD
jgi:hypothetical protein